MGYKNPHSIGFQVERQISGDYNINSHGDLGAFYNSVMQVDRPQYTNMFYSPSEHENFTEFKYDKIEVGYDKGLKQAKDGVRGPPIEVYIPSSVIVPDGAGKTTVETQVMPKQTIVDEILKAQAEIFGKADDKVLGKDIKAIRLTEIEQKIILKRKIRRVEFLQGKWE